MGLPVSAHAEIANSVMEDIEQRALAATPVKRFFWKRYVDYVMFAASKNDSFEPNEFNHLRGHGGKWSRVAGCMSAPHFSSRPIL